MEVLGVDNIFFQVSNLETAIPFYETLGFVLKFKLPHVSAALFNIVNEKPGLLYLHQNHKKHYMKAS